MLVEDLPRPAHHRVHRGVPADRLELAADGEGLAAGQIVLSGGLTAAVPVGPGDVVTASSGRLGSMELACR